MGPRGAPRPYKFIGFGDIYGPKPYKFIARGAPLAVWAMSSPSAAEILRELGRSTGPAGRRGHGAGPVGQEGRRARAEAQLSGPRLRLLTNPYFGFLQFLSVFVFMMFVIF